MSQRASELNAEGKQFDEIVDIIADEWGIINTTARAVVDAWWEGKVSRNFNYDAGD